MLIWPAGLIPPTISRPFYLSPIRAPPPELTRVRNVFHPAALKGRESGRIFCEEIFATS